MSDSKPPPAPGGVIQDSRPGFLSSLFGGSSTAQTAPPAIETHQTDANSTRTASESIPAPSLPPIRTPHDESPISHPELSFTPSDIGIWEVNKIKGTPTAEKGGTFGFWRK